MRLTSSSRHVTHDLYNYVCYICTCHRQSGYRWHQPMNTLSPSFCCHEVCRSLQPYPHSQAIGETAWQIPRVQTVYGCNITVIVISHSTRQYWISARDTIFPAVRMGSACTSTIERSLLKWNGHDCDISMYAWRIWVYCCNGNNVLKFDWYCQPSRKGSNSLNSWKLPGHFFYGLRTRLL